MDPSSVSSDLYQVMLPPVHLRHCTTDIMEIDRGENQGNKCEEQETDGLAWHV